MLNKKNEELSRLVAEERKKNEELSSVLKEEKKKTDLVDLSLLSMRELEFLNNFYLQNFLKIQDAFQKRKKIEEQCKVCFENKIEKVCYPCGHTCLCESCKNQLCEMNEFQCPICRAPVFEFVTIYN